ncbi:hypothetical protein TNCV_4934141 [Trichonephila clavipes]|nr:hypothetical protein TNCV_4934141 [Trichonephila clavipes]
MKPSIRPLLYREKLLTQCDGMGSLCLQYMVTHSINPWHYEVQRYVPDILQPYVLPLMLRLPEAIFQQDRARPYMSRLSQDCLRTANTLP